MKKSERNRELIIVTLILVLVLIFVSVYVEIRSQNTPLKKVVKVYYYDPIARELVPVEQNVEISSDPVSSVYQLLALLKKPEDPTFFPLVDQNINVRSIKVEDGLCTLDLSIVNPGDLHYAIRKEAAVVYGIVNTITQVEGIKKVRFLIDGSQREVFIHYIRIDELLEQFDALLPKGTSINLYFPTNNLDGLVIEKREVFKQNDPVKLSEEIIGELLKGSLYGLPTIVPQGILKSFSIGSNGIAFVNFNESVLNLSMGSQLEMLFLSSIVDTLTEIPDITAVQFLLEDKIVPSIFGSIATGSPLKRFLTYDYNYLVPYYVYEYNGETFFSPTLYETDSASVEELFEMLKIPPVDYKTKLPSEAKLISYKSGGGLLETTIDVGNISGDDLELLKTQIALSFTDMRDINSVQLSIGEESFKLKR